MKDKKTVVLVVLVVVLLGVGVFQFAGPKPVDPEPAKSVMKDSPSPVNSEKAAKNSEDKDQRLPPDKQALLALVTGKLEPRDPFLSQDLPAPEPESQPEPKTQQPTETPIRPKRATRPSAPRATWRPSADLPASPVEPLPGNLGVAVPEQPASDQVVLKPAPPARNPDEFAYNVKGVIVGRKPMAVFEDDDGNQMLVPLGGSVGRGRVVGIEKGKVRVRHRGKDKTLNLMEISQ